jgi:hypothetical protein
MKAALSLWSSRSNLFHTGFAKETHDAAIVAATLARPGVVLRRPVGSQGVFREHAELPKLSALRKAIGGKPAHNRITEKKTAAPKESKKADPAATRKAAQLYDLAERRRERDAARDSREEAQRARAIQRAQTALDEARERHEARAAGIAEEQDALEHKARKEDARWHDERLRLEAALKQARE